MDTIVEQARQVLKRSHTVASTIDRVPSGQRSVYGIVSHVISGGSAENSELAREIRGSDSRAVATAAPPVVVVRPAEPKVVSPDAAPKYGLLDVIHGTKPNIIYADKETVVAKVVDPGRNPTPTVSLSPVTSNNGWSDLRIATPPGTTSTSMKPAAPAYVIPTPEKTNPQTPFPPAAPAPQMQKPAVPEAATGAAAEELVLPKSANLVMQTPSIKTASLHDLASTQGVPATSTSSRPTLPRAEVDALVELLRKDQRSWCREEAANSLAECDPNKHSEAVSALAHAALIDRSLQVRIASLRSLRVIRADTPEVRAALHRIRAEGQRALQEDAARALEQMSVTPVSSRSMKPNTSGVSDYAPRAPERSGY